MQQMPNLPSSSNDWSDFVSEDMAVVIHDACCAWSRSDEEVENLVLNHVTLGLPKGLLVAVIGEVRYPPAAVQYSFPFSFG